MGSFAYDGIGRGPHGAHGSGEKRRAEVCEPRLQEGYVMSLKIDTNRPLADLSMDGLAIAVANGRIFLACDMKEKADYLLREVQLELTARGAATAELFDQDVEVTQNVGS